MTSQAHPMNKGSDAELIDRHRGDILALDDAAAATIYGGLFDAFSGETYTVLRNAGLIRSYIPAGCMAPITKLTPKGRKAAANLRALTKVFGRCAYAPLCHASHSTACGVFALWVAAAIARRDA